jgi:hypothetical protein
MGREGGEEGGGGDRGWLPTEHTDYTEEKKVVIPTAD